MKNTYKIKTRVKNRFDAINFINRLIQSMQEQGIEEEQFDSSFSFKASGDEDGDSTIVLSSNNFKDLRTAHIYMSFNDIIKRDKK